MGKLNFKSLKGKMNALKKFYSGHCRKCFFWRPSQEREGAPAFAESEEEGTNPDRSSKAQRHVLGRNGGGGDRAAFYWFQEYKAVVEFPHLSFSQSSSEVE